MTKEELRRICPKASDSFMSLNAKEQTRPFKVGQEPLKLSSPHGINQTEREYESILKAEHGQKSVYFERYTLRLAPDLRYTPDLVVIGPRFALDFYEVKNRRHIFDRSLHKPKLAAQLYPWHRFFIAVRELSGEWAVSQISRLP